MKPLELFPPDRDAQIRAALARPVPLAHTVLALAVMAGLLALAVTFA
jgi:hypothetical protein